MKTKEVNSKFAAGVARQHRENMHLVGHVCVPLCSKMSDCMLVRSGMKDLCKGPIGGASAPSTEDHLSVADRAIVNASVKALRGERMYMEQVCAPKCARWHDCRLISDGMRDLCKGPIGEAPASPLRDERALWNYTNKGVLSDPITGLPRNQEEASASSLAQYGEAPFLECSSHGDKRLSAFYARVNGRSIEEQYQAAKVFEDGSTGLHWRKAKGRKPVNAAECADLYEKLWRQYISEHPELLDILKKASGLSDMFARKGGVNQAHTLWKIRNEQTTLAKVGASASSQLSENDRRVVQRARELKEAMSSKAPNNYDWGWEAHMDCLLAPPETQKVEEIKLLYPAPRRACFSIVYDHADLFKSHPEAFRQSPILKQGKGALPDFWIKSPSTRLSTLTRDNSRYHGFFDPDSVAARIDDAVVSKVKWNTSKGIPVYTWEYRAYKEDPNTPRHIYTGEDTYIKESELRSISHADMDDDDDGYIPYISPREEAKEFGDKDAIAFVPAFIFGPGKPVWSKVIAFDSKKRPYYKLVKHQSLRPIGCKVRIENGYVLPVGAVSAVTKIKTRADRKRARAFSAIRKELTPYVGVERAREMASKEVAAMAASC